MMIDYWDGIDVFWCPICEEYHSIILYNLDTTFIDIDGWMSGEKD